MKFFGDGGGIRTYTCDLHITGSVIRFNTAHSGGGVYSQYGPLTITNSSFVGNLTLGSHVENDIPVAGPGGGLHVHGGGHLQIINSAFVSNSTPISNDGGGTVSYTHLTLPTTSRV